MMGITSLKLDKQPAMRTFIRLAIISIIVGFFLYIIGFDPADLWEMLARLVRHLFVMGYFQLYRVVQYLIMGAMIVVPIWLVLRLLRTLRR